MRTTVGSEGSVPPARTLFACIYELNDKPFSDPQIKDCVGKLSANYFVRDVKVHMQETEDGWVNIVFVLSGEPLTINEITLETFDKQEAEVWKFLSLSNFNLHVGGMYSWPSESWTNDMYLAGDGRTPGGSGGSRS